MNKYYNYKKIFKIISIIFVFIIILNFTNTLYSLPSKEMSSSKFAEIYSFPKRINLNLSKQKKCNTVYEPLIFQDSGKIADIIKPKIQNKDFPNIKDLKLELHKVYFLNSQIFNKQKEKYIGSKDLEKILNFIIIHNKFENKFDLYQRSKDYLLNEMNFKESSLSRLVNDGVLDSHSSLLKISACLDSFDKEENYITTIDFQEYILSKLKPIDLSINILNPGYLTYIKKDPKYNENMDYISKQKAWKSISLEDPKQYDRKKIFSFNNNIYEFDAPKKNCVRQDPLLAYGNMDTDYDDIKHYTLRFGTLNKENFSLFLESEDLKDPSLGTDDDIVFKKEFEFEEKDKFDLKHNFYNIFYISDALAEQEYKSFYKEKDYGDYQDSLMFILKTNLTDNLFNLKGYIIEYNLNDISKTEVKINKNASKSDLINKLKEKNADLEVFDFIEEKDIWSKSDNKLFKDLFTKSKRRTIVQDISLEKDKNTIFVYDFNFSKEDINLKISKISNTKARANQEYKYFEKNMPLKFTSKNLYWQIQDYNQNNFDYLESMLFLDKDNYNEYRKIYHRTKILNQRNIRYIEFNKDNFSKKYELNEFYGENVLNINIYELVPINYDKDDLDYVNYDVNLTFNNPILAQNKDSKSLFTFKNLLSLKGVERFDLLVSILSYDAFNNKLYFVLGDDVLCEYDSKKKNVYCPDLGKRSLDIKIENFKAPKIDSLKTYLFNKNKKKYDHFNIDFFANDTGILIDSDSYLDFEGNYNYDLYHLDSQEGIPNFYFYFDANTYLNPVLNIPFPEEKYLKDYNFVSESLDCKINNKDYGKVYVIDNKNKLYTYYLDSSNFGEYSMAGKYGFKLDFSLDDSVNYSLSTNNYTIRGPSDFSIENKDLGIKTTSRNFKRISGFYAAGVEGLSDSIDNILDKYSVKKIKKEHFVSTRNYNYAIINNTINSSIKYLFFEPAKYNLDCKIYNPGKNDALKILDVGYKEQSFKPVLDYNLNLLPKNYFLKNRSKKYTGIDVSRHLSLLIDFNNSIRSISYKPDENHIYNKLNKKHFLLMENPDLFNKIFSFDMKIPRQVLTYLNYVDYEEYNKKKKDIFNFSNIYEFKRISNTLKEEVKKDKDYLDLKRYLLIIGNKNRFPENFYSSYYKDAMGNEVERYPYDHCYLNKCVNFNNYKDSNFYVGRIPFNTPNEVYSYYKDLPSIRGKNKSFFLYPEFKAFNLDPTIFRYQNSGVPFNLHTNGLESEYTKEISKPKEKTNTDFYLLSSFNKLFNDLHTKDFLQLSSHGAFTLFSLDDQGYLRNADLFIKDFENRPGVMVDSCNTAYTLGENAIKKGFSYYLGFVFSARSVGFYPPISHKKKMKIGEFSNNIIDFVSTFNYSPKKYMFSRTPYILLGDPSITIIPYKGKTFPKLNINNTQINLDFNSYDLDYSFFESPLYTRNLSNTYLKDLYDKRALLFFRISDFSETKFFNLDKQEINNTLNDYRQGKISKKSNGIFSYDFTKFKTANKYSDWTAYLDADDSFIFANISFIDNKLFYSVNGSYFTTYNLNLQEKNIFKHIIKDSDTLDLRIYINNQEVLQKEVDIFKTAFGEYHLYYNLNYLDFLKLVDAGFLDNNYEIVIS